MATTRLGIILAALVMATPALAQTVICTKPDGTKYAGTNPPEGCVVEKKYDDSKAGPAASGYISPGDYKTAQRYGAGTEVAQQIRRFCGGKWPGNYQMQEHCIKTQMTAGGNLKSLMSANEGNATFDGIVGQCSAKWQVADGWNWQMVEHCVKTQAGAYNRLHGE